MVIKATVKKDFTRGYVKRQYDKNIEEEVKKRDYNSVTKNLNMKNLKAEPKFAEVFNFQSELPPDPSLESFDKELTIPQAKDAIDPSIKKAADS